MLSPLRRPYERLATAIKARSRCAYRARMFALLLAFAASSVQAVDESDLLPVDRAFALSAEAVAPDEVQIRWKIADGYYLYRHRTSAQTLDSDVRVGTLQLPRGEAHQDEFFGATETYRKELAATLPEIASPAGKPLRLRIKYQGCADLGVCYPPQMRTLNVMLPSATPVMAASTPRGLTDTPQVSGEGNPLAALGRPFGGNLDTNGGKVAPLPEDQAFSFEAIADGGDALLLRFTPARGYYLYRDRTVLKLEADGITLDTPRWPRGRSYRDEHFGDVIVYFDQIDVSVPLRRVHTDAQTVVLRATFQGCQDEGICYPPMARTARIALPAGTRAQASPAATGAAGTASTTRTEIAAADPAAPTDAATPPPSLAAGAPPSVPTAAAPAEQVSDVGGTPGGDRPSNLFVALLFALLGGLILNLMPCVLPVLSMKVLGLIESGESPQRARAHALWYTAGVVLSFMVLGGTVLALRHFAAALGWGTQIPQGQGWGFQMQQPVVIAVLALLMFVFGLSLSGVWHVGGQWTGMGHGLTNRKGRVGDFFTGALAVVVAAPCTAPFMAPALGWAFTAPAPSAVLVFAILGLGLALPFLAVGFVPGLAARLPKPGAWMDTFKQLLAFPLYLTAAWLVWVLAKQRGADAFGWWAIAATALALAAWALTHAQRHAARWSRVPAVFALLFALWPLWTIAHLPRVKGVSTATEHATQSVSAMPFSERRLADLRAANRVVLVNMTADWCITCKVNEKAVFSRARFSAALTAADAVYMVGDWTDVDPAITAYLRRYKAVGVPLYVVYPRGGGEGRVLPTVLTPGLVEAALTQAANSAARP
ncbi:MAG: cytochrome C biogenesis protein [Lysobacteraceae bacterium]|nr:MAG: cytochrome C biogenesis protein [Xanthomonadaceae bacterium]